MGETFVGPSLQELLLKASWSLLELRCDSGVLQAAKMSPRGLQNDPKIHPKWSQEGVKITLGSHLAKKHEKLNFGCYLLYFRHVGPPPKPSKFEPFGKENCHKMHHESQPAKKTPKSHQRLQKLSPKG